jgi:hypothetical protein
MKMPQHAPTADHFRQIKDAPQKIRMDGISVENGLTQAGCCLQVCAPIVGCHCVAESPLC